MKRVVKHFYKPDIKRFNHLKGLAALWIDMFSSVGHFSLEFNRLVFYHPLYSKHSLDLFRRLLDAPVREIFSPPQIQYVWLIEKKEALGWLLLIDLKFAVLKTNSIWSLQRKFI